jgi:phosphate transport system permease protein
VTAAGMPNAVTLPRASRAPRLRAGRGRGGMGDAVFVRGTQAVAVGIITLFAAVVAVLLHRAWPAIDAFGLPFLWGESWDPPGQRFGALPYLAGTVVTSLVGLAVAVPVAIGTAIALTELLPRWIAGPVGVVVELLAAVPSIVLGVWGFAVVAPFVRDLAPEGRTFGPSLLAAGLVLAVMALPIIAAVTRDMLRSVAPAQRDAALALGLTPWEVTWRVVLPNARPGIVAAALLGLGRALGETMAVIMVVGNQPLLPESLWQPGSTIASVIANEFGDPSGPLHSAALVELGLVLLALSLAVSLTARHVVRRWGRREAL